MSIEIYDDDKARSIKLSHSRRYLHEVENNFMAASNTNITDRIGTRVSRLAQCNNKLF
jgi:hypothetical protein